jgi:bacterial/archaeal transporter family protein
MNSTLGILLAASVAMFMVTLARAGVSPDFRTAIRTTLVMVLAWGFAYAHYGLKPWSSLTWQTKWMLPLSALILILAWLFHFHTRRKKNASPVVTMDQINVGFAIVFAVLFLSDKTMTQSPFIAIMLIGGALVLALGQR